MKNISMGKAAAAVKVKVPVIDAMRVVVCVHVCTYANI